MNSDPDEHRADQADDDRADAVDVAGRRGDADKAADHAVDAADERRLLLLASGHVHDDPGHHRDGGGEVGVDHRRGGVRAGEVRVTAVEAVPAEPQDAGAERDERQVVGLADRARSLVSRGPTTAAATKPDTPAARWIT